MCLDRFDQAQCLQALHTVLKSADTGQYQPLGFANLFGTSIANQAGVSVHLKDGQLYAFDESSLPYALDPESLETEGQAGMGLPDGADGVFGAHPKTDGRTGEWVHFGLGYGRDATIYLTRYDAAGVAAVLG